MPDRVRTLVQASNVLAEAVGTLRFAEPVHTVYNPLEYARAPWEAYLGRYATTRKRVVLLGMNPGPWGMAQTGVPFGEIATVRGWLGIEATVGRPATEHPKRPVEGFSCARSEVSGRRLWGLFRERYGTPERFFAEHFVANYCPLVFMAESGRNITPDKLPAAEREPLFEACDRFLRTLTHVLEPEYLIGVGRFATDRARSAVGVPSGTNGPPDEGSAPKVATILHPSPASPAANRGWAGTATRQLIELGVWKS